MLTTYIEKSQALILQAKNFDAAIKMARFFGELLWKNNLGQYHLTSLENALVEKYAHLFDTDFKIENRGTYLHLLTKAYETGGHTRIVERLIHSDALQSSAILVTESVDPRALKKLSSAKHGCTRLEKQGNSQLKIQAIIHELAKCQIAILHLHPHDIETTIAVAIAKKKFNIRVLLYNHADHVFSFGHGVADRILELSHFGWALRHKRDSENKSTFTGIPLALPKKSTVSKIPHSDAYIASAGSAYKFKPGQGYSFPNFVASLIEKIELPFILIGADPWSSPWWWSIFFQEKFRTKPRLQFAKKMSHEKYVSYLSNASAYIDSFPMTGGTAFPEILSLGVPCFGVLTGAHGYTPADRLKSENMQRLSDDLLHFLATQERPGINLDEVMEQVYQAHDTDKVAARVAIAANTKELEEKTLWDNPAAIDTQFYEKIWRNQKLFSMPVHTFPNIFLFRLFISYWFRRNNAT
jgi:hypothetical protein